MDCRKALGSVLLATGSLITFGVAQTALAQGTSLSPENFAPDQNGVNWLGDDPGELRANIGIGESNSGLAYEEDLSIKRFNDWSYFITVDHIFSVNYYTKINVSLGKSSKTYKSSIDGLPPYVPYQQDGSSIVYNQSSNTYTYTGGDGTVVNFEPIDVPLQLNGFGGLVQYIGKSIVRPDGERLELTYKTAPAFGGNAFRLQSVKSNRGYSLKIQYVADTLNTGSMNGVRLWHRRASVKILSDGSDYCDVNALGCTGLLNAWPTLTFDSQGDFYGMGQADSNGSGFVSATDSAGVKKTFQWSGTGTRETFQTWTKFGDSPQITEMSYVSTPFYAPFDSDVVFTATSELGSWTYGYYEDVGPAPYSWNPAFSPHWYRRWRKDPANNVVQIAVFDSLVFGGSSYVDTGPPSVVDIIDENGRRTHFSYGLGGLVSAIIPPEATVVGGVATAGYTGFEYDARGNKMRTTQYAKAGSGLANIVIESEFPSSCGIVKTCNKPTWSKDAAGNQTNFTYDASHGGILSELKPAVTIGSPGSTVSARPLTLTTWTQRNAWVKSSPSGSLVMVTDPIWVQSTVTECQAAPGSNSPICDGSKPSTVTTYQYGATGTAESLLVKGVAVASGGTTLRTCFGYDIYHRKISTTEPRADLSTCP